MSSTNLGGGQVDQLKIDPVTGKPYTSAGKVSGTDINSVRGTVKSVDKFAETPEAPETTTVVVMGTPGWSIASAAVTDEHLILTFNDGSTFDAGVVTGSPGTDGIDGQNGPGFTAATINGTGHLILTKTDNSTVDLGKVVADDGANGTDGVDGIDGIGYSGANIDGDGHLVLTTTDGQTLDLGVVRGTAGQNGKTVLSGTTAPTGGLGVNGDFYLDTTTFELYGPKGTPSAGWNTPVVIKGTDGEDGTDGVDGDGFTAAEIDTDGHLILTKMDGTTTVDLGLVKGTDGTDGDDGADAPSIASAAFDAGNLVFTLSDASTIDAGAFPAFVAPDTADLVELPADASDEATAVALANAMKALLISLGLAK